MLSVAAADSCSCLELAVEILATAMGDAWILSRPEEDLNLAEKKFRFYAMVAGNLQRATLTCRGAEHHG